ncbi:hypothetical protein [Paraburkholderia caribensis]|uniref:hypothetical protein n=1 Tax=Paraburkholderia caribensis TaxID=75105 RepID=UPI0020919787|nr:hypothetical protein [Paraburkholderia caribensis]MCO4880255.1 hypothetical protein [Paraburkholderia caribensis]
MLMNWDEVTDESPACQGTTNKLVVQITKTRSIQIIALREVLGSITGVIDRARKRMIEGDFTPQMFRHAVSRLNALLLTAGTLGDYKSERAIVELLSELTATASYTLYQ